MLLGRRDNLGLPGADGGNRMPRYTELLLHCANTGTLCQSLDTLMVHLRSISEYPLCRMNRWAGLLGLTDLGWKVTWMMRYSFLFGGHRFNRCSILNIYINTLDNQVILDIKHIVRNKTCQVFHKYRNYNILSIFLLDLGRMTGGRGSEEQSCPLPPTD